jgi:hypothetical protein
MSVKRENFPLSSVEESLAKLANAVAFSKLGANSSLWQTNLATELRLILSLDVRRVLSAKIHIRARRPCDIKLLETLQAFLTCVSDMRF